MIESVNNMSLLVKFIKERLGMSSPTSKPYKHAEYCLISLPLGEVTVVCVGLITYSFFVRSKISCSSFFILSIVIFSIVVFFKGALAFENNVARKPVIYGESELALVKDVLLWSEGYFDGNWQVFALFLVLWNWGNT
jgi:hypothetical protein